MSTDEEPDSQRLLEAYLEELENALAPLPRERREQLVDEISEHVTSAIAFQQPASAWELRELLQKVGSPKQIAEAALEEEGPQHPRRPRLVSLVVVSVVLLVALGTTVGIVASSPTGVRSSLRRSETAKRPAGPPVTSSTTTVPPGTTMPSATTTTVPPATTRTTTVPPTTITTTPGPAPASGITETAVGLPMVASCEEGVAPTTRPTLLFFGCASSAINVDQITWTSWTATSATGYGTLNVNQCQPSCAAGTFDHYPATIHITNPLIMIGNQPIFQDISVVTNQVGPVETGSDPTNDWGFVAGR